MSPSSTSRTTRAKEIGVALSTALIASLTLAACGSLSMGSAGKVSITLYSGQHVQTTDALVAGFEKVYPNISVAVRSNDEDTFASQIVAEGPRSPADV
ncbi:MAG TPA: hypothetical protein VII65_06995, partial [Acidimicrobiales bacterium]